VSVTTPTQARPHPGGGNKNVIWIILYVALVLGVDTLAYEEVHWLIDWTLFRWVWGDVEVFKLVFWLFIPLAFSWKNFDRGWYGLARWQAADLILLLTLAALGGLVLMLVPLIPELREGYTGVGGMSAEIKREFVIGLAIWNLSWLPAWEFLMRYVLLRTATARWPRFGWWLVPLVEGIYHLQKSLPEALAAVAFSAVLTYWAFTRRNGLLPLVAHLIIEIELVALMLIW
jgi:hypothetical protein